MAKGNYKFKGGGSLEGIYEGYHEIMMKNELEDGKGAYKLSWAETKKSGPTFGGNQMDIAHNPHGRSIFLNIVKNATDGDGNKVLSLSEISKIEQIVSGTTKMVGLPLIKVFDELVPKIDAALQSSYGKQMIHQAYVNEMLSRGHMIERFIENLREGPGKNFAQSDIGKMCLFDFHNQYGIKVNGALNTFLNGGRYTLKSGKVIGPITKQDFGLEDFKMDFLFHLKYYNDNPGDVIRRLKNIEQHLKDENNIVDKISENNGNKVSMCDCAELFNVSKTCITRPTAVMVLGTKMHACRDRIESSSEQYKGRNAYDIFKELHGMDFDSYVKYVPQDI